MLRTPLAVFPLALAAAAQTAPPPPSATPSQAYVLRSGHVTMCQLDKGCKEETSGGRKYLVMESDGFLLKVASGADARHGYADITITNQTGAPQQVNPASFRMEESEPRLHRLFYVDPNRQLQPATFREQQEKPLKLSAPKGLPPPDYWTSGQAQEDRQAERKAKAVAPVPTTVPLLRAGSIAPDGTVSGRVYFERPRVQNGVSVVLALPGALFEFPCRFAVPARGKKRGKHEPAEAATDTTGY